MPNHYRMLDDKENKKVNRELYAPEGYRWQEVYIAKHGGHPPVRFLFTDLSPDLKKDLDGLLLEDEKLRSMQGYLTDFGLTNTDNAFVYQWYVSSMAESQIMSNFESWLAVPNFNDHLTITYVLVKDALQMREIANPQGRNLPDWVNGRVSRTHLLYNQDYLKGNAKQYSMTGIIEENIVNGLSHEMLHTLLFYMVSRAYSISFPELPVLLREGLNVFVGNQVQHLDESFIPPSADLLLENDVVIFTHDKRTLRENTLYQAAGSFMAYLIELLAPTFKISRPTTIEQDKRFVFQALFSFIGEQMNLDFTAGKPEFSVANFFDGFGVDVTKEYDIWASQFSDAQLLS